MMNFDQTPEFKKDLKRLLKKWRLLADDIEYAKPRITSLYLERHDIDIQKYRKEFFATKKAAIIASTPERLEIVKMRLDVESLGSNSKVRLVFVVARQADLVTFIELFAKNDKACEDQSRIQWQLRNR